MLAARMSGARAAGVSGLASLAGVARMTMMTRNMKIVAPSSAVSSMPSMSSVPSMRRLNQPHQLYQSPALPTTLGASLASAAFSTKPDYTNYETWHKQNYETPHEKDEKEMQNQYYMQLQHHQYQPHQPHQPHPNESQQPQQSPMHGHPSSPQPNQQQQQPNPHPEGPPRTSVLMELTDRVGALHEVLKYFWKYDVNITRIESRPVSLDPQNHQPKFDFFVDFHGRVDDPHYPNVHLLLRELETMTDKLLVLDEKEVHWFPRHISELDLIANRTLDAGTDLQSDHPGFHDEEYRKRRAKLAELALNYTLMDGKGRENEIPMTEYSAEEVETWGKVWERMEGLWEEYACKEYKNSLQLMKHHCHYSPTTIPQLSTISSFLSSHTSFRLRPVAGLISSRDFLNGLAFRVFFCTQYIRHGSRPLYTPEPDICHELLGHVPMFADRDFCDFSQEIGLASLGASDEDILKLARCYWHSVEFGLCLEDGKHKAYGAGLLSSFGELEYACKERTPEELLLAGKVDDDGMPLVPEIKPWDPAVASRQEFPITTYQPVYFLAESLQDGKKKMRKFCEELPRPFFALYNDRMKSVHIDRPVRRCVGVPGGEVEGKEVKVEAEGK